MYAIGGFIRDSVPVPEVGGWCTNGSERFIYMEHVKGLTLAQVRDTMKPDERSAFLLRAPGEFGEIMSSLTGSSSSRPVHR